MKPTLVVLAAGMGSRYGGLKQVDPVGPSGEAILDYSVFDAMRGGFGKVVFIIRRDFEEEFKARSARSTKGFCRSITAIRTLPTCLRRLRCRRDVPSRGEPPMRRVPRAMSCMSRSQS